MKPSRNAVIVFCPASFAAKIRPHCAFRKKPFSAKRSGEKIIFAERTTALASSLRQSSVKGGASELIATGGSPTSPAVSADGKTLAFVEDYYRLSIGQLENTLPARKLIESSKDDHSSNFSPDNAHIVFVSNRTGNQEIWLSEADGKNQRHLFCCPRPATAV